LKPKLTSVAIVGMVLGGKYPILVVRKIAFGVGKNIPQHEMS